MDHLRPYRCIPNHESARSRTNDAIRYADTSNATRNTVTYGNEFPESADSPADSNAWQVVTPPRSQAAKDAQAIKIQRKILAGCSGDSCTPVTSCDPETNCWGAHGWRMVANRSIYLLPSPVPQVADPKTHLELRRKLWSHVGSCGGVVSSF